MIGERIDVQDEIDELLDVLGIRDKSTVRKIVIHRTHIEVELFWPEDDTHIETRSYEVWT